MASSCVLYPVSLRCLPSAFLNRTDYVWEQRIDLMQSHSLKKVPIPRASCRAM